MNTLTFLNKDTNDISNMIDLALSQYEYTNDQKVRYTFCIEETLLKWQEVFAPEEPVTLIRWDKRSSFGFEISISGQKIDTMQENTSTDLLEALVPRMKSGVGHEIAYSYHRGKNRLTINLPKKKIEQTLFTKNIKYISTPIVTQHILLSISTIIDSIMLSLLNQEAMSAASLVSSMALVFGALTYGFTTGMTTIFGKYWGARDFEKATSIMAFSLKCIFLLGFAFCAACLICPSFVMMLFTDIPEIQQYGSQYMRALALFFIFNGLAEVFACFMRNAGEVKLSSVFVIISQFLNAILNALLIFGLLGFPEMGIVGAGIATTISSVVLFLLTFIWFLRKKFVHFKVVHFLKISKPLKKEYNNIVLPTLFSSLAFNLGNTVISSIFGHLGEEILAANVIKNTIFKFFFCYTEGTAQACNLVQSKVVGQKQIDKAQRNERYAMVYFALSSTLIAVVMMLGVPYYTALFGGVSDEAQYYFNYMMIVSAVSLVLGQLNSVIVSGAFFPAGDTKELLVFDVGIKWGAVILPGILGTTLFSMPMLLLLGLLNADQILSFPLKYIHYKRGKWLKLIKEQINE